MGLQGLQGLRFVDAKFVNTILVKGNVVGDRSDFWQRVLTLPRSIHGLPAVHRDGVVRCMTFSWTKGNRHRANESGKVHVALRYIEHRRVVGFLNDQGIFGIGDRTASKPHHHPSRGLRDRDQRAPVGLKLIHGFTYSSVTQLELSDQLRYSTWYIAVTGTTDMEPSVTRMRH